MKRCNHPGCANHISHPCEKCSRIGGVHRRPALTHYIVKLRKLHKMIKDGTGESPYAEIIREDMDELWKDMDEDEMEFSREVSQKFYDGITPIST